MGKAIQKHIEAVKSGYVTRTNVIGIRKALNAYERIKRGYSVSMTQPEMSDSELLQLSAALRDCEPVVTGQLVETGIRVLNNKRYRRQLERVSDILPDIKQFRLIGFEYSGQCQLTPKYRAIAGNGDSFGFINPSWQSGGNGPETFDIRRKA